jgi:hypothetical protein
MLEINAYVDEDKNAKTIAQLIAILATSVLLSLMTSHIWGTYVGISVLLVMVFITIMTINRGNLGFVFQVTCLVVFTVVNCIVPGGYLIHTRQGTILNDKLILVWPFVHESSIKKAPDMTGQFQIKNELPENWSVKIWYWVPPNAILETRDWEVFQKIVSEGVDIPPTLLEQKNNPTKPIEAYLEKLFPFMRTEVKVIKYIEAVVWE